MLDNQTVCECCLMLAVNGVCHEAGYYSDSCEQSAGALAANGRVIIGYDTGDLEPHFGNWCSLCGYGLAGNRFNVSVEIVGEVQECP